ncbi:MAG: hypothetical protein EBE86_029670 [Hormoscilla sp. GUM202]|nr:hypothetical protein [Hormoscilla sp. GUM202]
MEPLPDSAIVYRALLRKWWIDSETYEFAIPENNISLTPAEYCQPPTSLLALKIPTRNVETRSLASLQK